MKQRAANGFTDRIREITETTRRELTRELERVEEEKARLTADLDQAAVRIKETLRSLGGMPGVARRTRTAPSRKRGKRIRRGSDQLKSEAEAIFKLIKSAGAEGTRGSDIRKQHPKVGPSIKDFLHKHGGHKVKTAGVKAQMRYIAA